MIRENMELEIVRIILDALLTVLLVGSLLFATGCVMNLGGSLAISNRSNADIATADTDGLANTRPKGTHSVQAEKTTEASAAVNTSSGKATTNGRKSEKEDKAEGAVDNAETVGKTGGDVK